MNDLWDEDERYAHDGYPGSYRGAGPAPRSPAEALEPGHPPEPPTGRRHRRRPNKFVSILNAVFTTLFVGLISLAALFYYAKTEFDRAGPLKHSTVVVIPKGEGVNAIASRLEREGIISDRRIFVASTLYFHAQARLKAGDYAIGSSASMRKVLDTLVEGKAILSSVTFPEGLTSQQVADRLNTTAGLTGKITEIPAEGSLMPDTYRYARNTPRQDIIERMKEAQTRFLDKVWESRAKKLPIKTKVEAVILASIVEKETGRADERGRVAAVFVNRLRRRMRLGSDPTIIYGITHGKGPLGRPIMKADIREKTAYNTYVIRGLPPTPIANPGRAAIEAVLRPADSNDLYFVADGTGGHAFAKSLASHKENVLNWREIERKRREEEAKRKAEEEAAALAAAQAGGNAADGTTQDLQSSGTVPGLIGAVTIPLPVRKPRS